MPPSSSPIPDPRLEVLGHRLEPARRILIFASAKGGVGKSVCAVGTALALSEAGCQVGLLDLDFQGASDHLIMGIDPEFPREDRGLIPLGVRERLHFMSVAVFSKEAPVALRGSEGSSALLELLAITRWPELDFLVVDMPPGIGDEVMDLFRYLPRAEFILVSTPSRLARQVGGRLLEVLRRVNAPVLGLIENMSPLTGSASGSKLDLPLLASIPFIPDFEARIGSMRLLLEGLGGDAFARATAAIQRVRGKS